MRSLLLAVLLAAFTVDAQVPRPIAPAGKGGGGVKPRAEQVVDGAVSPTNVPAAAPAPASAPERGASRKSDAKAPPASAQVVLYAASWCPYCQQARAYLARSGIPYKEVDIDSPAGRAAFAAAGGGGVPLLVFRGDQLRGYSELAYDFFFAGQQ